MLFLPIELWVEILKVTNFREVLILYLILSLKLKLNENEILRIFSKKIPRVTNKTINIKKSKLYLKSEYLFKKTPILAKMKKYSPFYINTGNIVFATRSAVFSLSNRGHIIFPLANEIYVFFPEKIIKKLRFFVFPKKEVHIEADEILCEKDVKILENCGKLYLKIGKLETIKGIRCENHCELVNIKIDTYNRIM